MPPLTNRLRAYPIRQVVQPLGSIAVPPNQLFYFRMHFFNDD